MLDQVLETAAQAVEPPDHQLVARPRVGQCLAEARLFQSRTLARHLVGVDMIGVAARRLQLVELQIERLFVGRDARGADLHDRSATQMFWQPVVLRRLCLCVLSHTPPKGAGAFAPSPSAATPTAVCGTTEPVPAGAAIPRAQRDRSEARPCCGAVGSPYPVRKSAAWRTNEGPMPCPWRGVGSHHGLSLPSGTWC